jgi:hypothetical protein
MVIFHSYVSLPEGIPTGGYAQYGTILYNPIILMNPFPLILGGARER